MTATRLKHFIDSPERNTPWSYDVGLASPGNTIQVLSASPQWVSLAVPCRMENVDRVLSMLEPQGTDLEPRQRDELCMAVREMLMNAIEHGGAGDPHRVVHLSCIHTHDAVLVQITDPGNGFSVSNLSHAAVGYAGQGNVIEHVEVREQQGIRPGGFGILLAQGLVDELIYNGKGNEVLLVKKLGKAGG